MAKQDGIPAWVWVGCGCLLCIVLLIGGCVAIGFAGFGVFKNSIEDMADPVARTAKVEEILGAEDGLPAGYHAHSVLSIPFALKLATLSDGPEPETTANASFDEKAEMMGELFPRRDDLGGHTFIFLQVKGLRDDQRLEDIFGGERVGNTTNIDLNLEFETTENLGDGTIDAAGTTVDWRAAGGRLAMLAGDIDAQWVELRFRCSDGKPRAGIWIEHPPAEGSLAGGPRLKTFLDHFSPCG